MQRLIHSRYAPYFVFLAALISRLLVLPFSETVDADSVTRIFNSLDLLDHPGIITNGIWAPLHYYFNAVILWVFPDRILAPKLMQILFAAATAFPLYHFTRREFNKEGAFFVALVYVFNPIVFRNSFHALSGIICAFFVISSLNYLSKALQANKGRIKYGIFSGILITVASGLRYEAWLLMTIIGVVLLLKREWKIMFSFSILALIFPVFWMIGNYIEYNDLFYGLSGAYNWNIVLAGMNENLTMEMKLRKLWFFPFSFVFSLSPVIVFLMLKGVWQKWKQHQIRAIKLMWILPFCIFFIVFIVKAIQGTLLLQHRFTISLIILSVPLLALYFSDISRLRFKIRLLTITIFLNLVLTQFYSSKSIRPIPLLRDRSIPALAELIKSKSTADKSLILDFLDWDSTYYLALRSGFTHSNIHIVSGAKYESMYLEEITKSILLNRGGIILVKADSRFSEVLKVEESQIIIVQSGLRFRYKEIYSVDDIKVYDVSLL